MLVKYFGLFINEETNKWTLRHEFISNGLFRMTQPKFLNDKWSESKLLPYFGNYSPADLAWARNRHNIIQTDPNYKPSDQELIDFHLRSTGQRYGECSPDLLKAKTGYETMDGYDKNQFEEIVKSINDALIEYFSSQIGVFSLCKSDNNKYMWTHYASEGKGIAVIFKEDHSFFARHKPEDVSYLPERRAAISSNKGCVRINGEPAKSFSLSNFNNPFNPLQELISRGIDIKDLIIKLLFSKDKIWEYENETRIICGLEECDVKTGDIITPELLIDCPESIRKKYYKICLKNIPFDAFESIVLGYDISEPNKNMIIEKVKANPYLSHIKIKIAQHNIYEGIKTTEINM